MAVRERGPAMFVFHSNSALLNTGKIRIGRMLTSYQIEPVTDELDGLEIVQEHEVKVDEITVSP